MTTRWKRILVASSLAGVVLAVLLVVGARAAAPIWARGAIERFVGKTLGRELEIGDFDLSFSLAPSLTAHDVTLSNPSWSAEPAMVRVGRLRIVVDLVSLWNGPARIRDIELNDVRVLLETDDQGRRNWVFAMAQRKGPPPADVPLVVERASLKGFELHYRRRGEPRWVVGVEGLEATLDPASHMIDLEARGRLDQTPWDVAGRLGALDRLYAARDVEQAVSGHIGSAALTLRGRIRDPLTLSGPNLELSIDGPDVVQALAVAGLRSPLSGPFRLHAVLAPADDAVGVELSAAAGGVTANAHGTVSSLLDPARIDATIDASGQHASEVGSWIRVAGLPHRPFDLAGGIRRDGRRLSLDGVAIHVGGTTVRVTGPLGELPRCLGTDLTIDATGDDLAVLSELSRVSLPEGPYELEGRFLRGADGLAIKDAELSVQGALVHASGTIGRPPRLENLDLSVDGAGPDASILSELAHFDLPTQSFELKGRIARDGAALALHDVAGRLGGDTFTVNGRVVPARRLVGTELQLRLKGHDLRAAASHAGLHGLPARPYEAVGGVHIASDHYAFDGIDATVGGLTVRLDGIVGSPTPLDGTSLLWRGRGQSLSELETWGVPVELPPDPFAASGRLRIDDGVYSVDDVSADIGADHLDLHGTLGKLPDLAALDITVDAAGPSLGDLGRFATEAGVELPPRIPKERYTIAGRARRVPEGVELEKVKVDVGESMIGASGLVSLADRSVGTDLTFTAEAHDTALLSTAAGTPLPEGGLRAGGRIQRTAEGLRFEDAEISLGPSFAELSGMIGERPRWEGTDFELKAEGPDLAAVLAPWTGPVPLPSDSFSLSTRITGNAERLASTRLDARLGDNDLKGNVSLRLVGKPFVDADLHSKQLDLPRLISGFTREPPVPETDGAPAKKRDKRERLIPDWPLALDKLRTFDARLKLVAESSPLAGIPFRDVTFSGRLEDGTVTVDRAGGTGQAGGQVTGILSLRPEGDGYRLEARGRLDGGRLTFQKSDVPSEQAPPLDVEYALSGAGRSLHEIAAGADGQILVMLGAGKIPNTLSTLMTSDVLAALLDALNPFRKSSPYSEFECGVIAAGIDDGKMVVKPIAARTNKMTVLGNGQLNLDTERIDLSWRIKPRSGVGVSGGSIANPYIKLGGTLAHPALDVKPLEAAASTGAAVATAGLTILFRGLYDRITAEKKVCVQALEKARKQIEEREARDAAAPPAPLPDGSR